MGGHTRFPLTVPEGPRDGDVQFLESVGVSATQPPTEPREPLDAIDALDVEGIDPDAPSLALVPAPRPERLDPPRDLLRRAVELGCEFVVDTDAHAPGQLDWQPYGCERAEECEVDVRKIVNTRSASIASSICTRSRRRTVGSIVVSHNWAGFISPRPL